MATDHHSQFSQKKPSNIVLGIDIGTSGIRGCIVEKSNETILLQHSIAMQKPQVNKQTGSSSQKPNIWIETLNLLFEKLSAEFNLNQVSHIVCDATSSTVLLATDDLTEYSDALMYNDSQASVAAVKIHQAITSQNITSAASGASSTIAKVTFLSQNHSSNHCLIVHQIDFINHYLCATKNVTDENNALKLGYDSIKQIWPNWVKSHLSSLKTKLKLPKVVKPGTPLANINQSLVDKFDFNPKAVVLAGTTDSIAGFLATGANKTGQAVTSLGSTIAIKAISSKPVFAPQYGLYSHRLWDWWLVGGASNTGGMVLLQFYNLDEIIFLLQKLEDRYSDSQLNALLTAENFYPLTSTGERFPIADPALQPNLPLKPDCNFDQITKNPNCLEQHMSYFIKLLVGLSQVEQLCYQRLNQLGADNIDSIYTVGGGIHNQVWMRLRGLAINAEISIADNTDAAFGVTRLLK